MTIQPGRLWILTGTAWCRNPTAQDREPGEDLAQQRPAKGSGKPPAAPLAAGGTKLPPEGQLLHCVPSCPGTGLEAKGGGRRDRELGKEGEKGGEILRGASHIVPIGLEP